MVVVRCQVEVSASGRSIVQRSATGCAVSECDCEPSIIRRPWPTRGHMTEDILGKYDVANTLQMTLFGNI